MREWFGYQVLSGVGYGLGVQIPYFAIQLVLEPTDIPVASALIAFCQSLGGTVGTAIAQNIFQSTLIKNLKKIEGVDVDAVVKAGGAGVADAVPAPLLSAARDAYNVAITAAFLVAVATAGISLIASGGMEWRTVPKKKTTTTTEEETQT
jgi:hypothetical protein